MVIVVVESCQNDRFAAAVDADGKRKSVVSWERCVGSQCGCTPCPIGIWMRAFRPCSVFKCRSWLVMTTNRMDTAWGAKVVFVGYRR